MAIIFLLALLLLLAGPELKDRTKQTLADPNIALAIALSGLLLIYVEFCFPGMVLPASLGGSLLLIAIAGLAAHPWNWPGVMVASAGVALIFVEARFQPYGLAGFAAAILLVLGCYTTVPGLRLSVVASLFVPWTVITIVLLRFAWLARQNKMVSSCFDR